MTDQDFVQACRDAQAEGKTELRATLVRIYRGVRHIAIRNLQGRRNGNPNDLWIESVSGVQTKGRAYLGSKNQPRRLEGWPERIAEIAG